MHKGNDVYFDEHPSSGPPLTASARDSKSMRPACHALVETAQDKHAINSCRRHCTQSNRLDNAFPPLTQYSGGRMRRLYVDAMAMQYAPASCTTRPAPCKHAPSQSRVRGMTSAGFVPAVAKQLPPYIRRLFQRLWPRFTGSQILPGTIGRLHDPIKNVLQP